MSKEQLSHCIVGIKNKQGKILGTGFVIAEGVIVTCGHVVQDIPAQINDEVEVTFSKFDVDYLTIVKMCNTEANKDIAILIGNQSLPSQVKPAILCSPNDIPKPINFLTFGYRKLGDREGVPARGQLVGTALKTTVSSLILETTQIGEGMSGAPLYIPEIERVVGMITSHWDSEKGKTGQVDKETAFANSAEVIREAWSDLEFQSPHVNDDSGFEFLDDDELMDDLEDDDEKIKTKKLNEFQKDIYDTFDLLRISSLAHYQTLAEHERLALNREILNKMIGLGGSPNELLEMNHVNTRFPNSLLKKVVHQGQQEPWDILHRKTAVYSDHSLICIAPITTAKRQYASSVAQDPSIDEKTINMLLQHRSLIEIGKMSIVPEVVKIVGEDFREKSLFNVKKLETVKVHLDDPVIKEFFFKEGKMLKREGTLVFNSPNSAGLHLEQILEIIEGSYPEKYKCFQGHLKLTMRSINPEDDTDALKYALRAVDDGIQALDAKYESVKRQSRSSQTTVRAVGSGALAVVLYTAGVDVMSFIAAAFAGSSLSSLVSFIPGSDPIPEEIRQSPFFIPWLIHHQS